MSNEERSKDRSSVTAFYAGRSIFVTGSTGFLGKVLIEKLLRSCPDVREIFLLMRPKNGLSIDQRLRKMLQLPLFDRLRKERPSTLEKLIPVMGDIATEGLGLGPVERRVIVERTSVIFHVAANVRFHENLKKDIFTNTRSTRDVCILAGGMKNLAVLVHVSSTYAHSDKPAIGETVYSPLADWKRTIKVVETLDERHVRIFTKKYLGTMPNTYTFSKRLAEQVIVDYSRQLPSVIFRPSIVVSTLAEPVPGWVDNFNGPVGLMIGGGKGILRTVCMDPNVHEDFVPVDVVVKAMILAGWKRGTERITQNPDPHVYNCASNDVQRITTRHLVEMALRINEKTPLDGTVWHPRVLITSSTWLYYVSTLLFHLVPALLIDTILKFSGRPPMLFDLHKRIYATNVQLRYFLHNDWNFANDKLLFLLRESVPPAEKEAFAYNYDDVNMEIYFEDCLIGAKKYLLHEDMNRQKQVRRHYDRMQWIDRLLRVWLAVVSLWLLGSSGALSYLAEILRSTIDGSMF